MSDEQRANALGKMVMEYGETSRNLALLCSQAEGIGRYLAMLGENLARHQSLHHHAGNIDLSKLPGQQQIQELAQQIDNLRNEKRNLSQRLKEAGYEPKE